MSTITIRILDGPDTGKEFSNVSLPVSIGREVGNDIQLNDDRVSRYHVRIQNEDSEMFVADLNSTNGTRVNGEHVQLALLRPGDVLILGRTIMVLGDREAIAQRLRLYDAVNPNSCAQMGMIDDDFREMSSLQQEKVLNWADFPNASEQLRTLLPPELPKRMSPLQRAQLSELLQYYQLRFRRMVETGIPVRDDQTNREAIPESPRHQDKKGQENEIISGYDRMMIPLQQWENLIDLYEKTAKYINETGEPDD